MKRQNNSTTARLVVSNPPEQEKRSVSVILGNVEDTLVNLGTLPTILNLLINDFNLDKIELTEPEQCDLVFRHEMIYDTIVLTRNMIIDTIDEIKKIVGENS